MMRGWLVIFASLLIWAGWFLAAYGLHGVQCAAGPLDTGARQMAQVVQIALWLAAIGAAAGMAWRTRPDGISQPPSLAVAAFWLNVIGLVAVIYTGVAVIWIAPC